MAKPSIIELKALVHQQPGIPLLAAAWLLRHHYKDLESAKCAIRAASARGKPHGVRVVKGEFCSVLVPDNGWELPPIERLR